MTKQIVGCSLDGLKDRCFIAGENSSRGDGFYLADVVLPDHYGGGLLTGLEAERSRVSTGMNWPPDAQVGVETEHILRRIPVSWAWRLLVDAKDKKFVSWTTGGLSFPLAKVLAVHIANRLNDFCQNPDEVILAIPNDLDEFGQEALLRELSNIGLSTSRNKPKLVWRPIAAAMAWLDRVQHQFPQNMGKSDLILVIHLGPDCIELTTFQLREKIAANKKFILPLRKPDHKRNPLSGCDWAAEFVQQMVGQEDIGAFWQAFTGFPEVWQSLAEIPWDENVLPRVWSRNGEWDLWNPAPNGDESIWQLPARSSIALKKLTSSNCPVKRNDRSYKSWSEFLQNEIKNTLMSCPAGRLWGVILSGPLMSHNPGSWLNSLYPVFQERGLDSKIVSTPTINTIWCPGYKSDIISEGAAIYGQRLLKGEPTYLDTLSPLHILASYRGRRKWIQLIKDEELEIEGGKQYKNQLHKTFSLAHGKKRLDVWLSKNTERDFKKADFHFAYSPETDMPLDIEVRMVSANGLAQIELIPENNDFLGGQKVFLDYSHMREMVLPPEKLGFPPIDDLPLDPIDGKLLSSWFQSLCSKFLEISLDDPKYLECIDELKIHIARPHRYEIGKGKWESVRIVNKDGKTATAEGQQIVDALASKLGDDFKRVLNGEIDRKYKLKTKILKGIFNAATWLYSSAPNAVVQYICDHFTEYGQADFESRLVIYAAGRCLSKPSDIQLTYRAAIRQNKTSGTFPVYWPATIYRLLSLREYAPDALQREDAEILLKVALARMQECVNESKFEIVFFNVIKMFFYILRYREIDQSFLSPSVSRDRKLFDEIVTALELAKKHFQRRRRGRREELAEKLMIGIKDYMNYEGSENIISLLKEISEDDEGE